MFNRNNHDWSPTGETDGFGKTIYTNGKKKIGVDESGLTYDIKEEENTTSYYPGGYGGGYSPLISDRVKIFLISIFLICGFIGSCVPEETRRKIENAPEEIRIKIENIFNQNMFNKEKILEETKRKIQDIFNKEKIEETRKKFMIFLIKEKER
jgi:hypothetical protein